MLIFQIGYFTENQNTQEIIRTSRALHTATGKHVQAKNSAKKLYQPELMLKACMHTHVHIHMKLDRSLDDFSCF